MVASVAFDRFVRFHSTAAPPAQAGENLDERGKTLEKVYAVGSPTVIVWDQDAESAVGLGGEEHVEDELWDNLRNVGDEDEEEEEEDGQNRRRKNVRVGKN